MEKRYASGEIDQNEFERMKKELERTDYQSLRK